MFDVLHTDGGAKKELMRWRAMSARMLSALGWAVMIGAGGEWPTHGNFQSGPAPSVEFNVIKDWLEIEVGCVGATLR